MKFKRELYSCWVTIDNEAQDFNSRPCPLCGADSWLIRVLCRKDEDENLNRVGTDRIFMYQCMNLISDDRSLENGDDCGLGFWRYDHSTGGKR